MLNKIVYLLTLCATVACADLASETARAKRILAEGETEMVLDAIEVNIPDEKQRAYFMRLLVAIRKSENGGPGRQFGIMSSKAKSFRAQAGWCACTVWNRHEEWLVKTDKERKEIPFLVYLANRYAPRNVDNDPLMLNYNWLKNVRYWMEYDL